MTDDREIYALKNFVGIMSDCRRRLVEDILRGNPNLLKYLYEDKSPALRLLYKQLYELKWLEAHWSQCQNLLADKKLPLATRREVLKIFLQWYQKFVEAWGYKSADAFFFNAKIQSLEILIDNNQRWEDKVDALQTEFLRGKKLLDKKIEEAKNL